MLLQKFVFQNCFRKNAHNILFLESKFVPINGKIVTESLKQCPEICKEKFEQEFFPDVR